MISEHASPLAVIGGVDSGGQNIYVAHLARCLAQLGHTVDVFTRRDHVALEPRVVLAPRLSVIHVDAGPACFVPKERLLDLMSEFALFCGDWMRTTERYDVVHANFFMSGWVGLQLKRTLGIPLVMTFHALGRVRREFQAAADEFPPERIGIEHRLIRESDRIVAECPQDLQDLERLYDADLARVAMIPCGFDAFEFQPEPQETARAHLGIASQEFTVLQLGRMVARKGIDTVVQAIARAPCAGIRLRIVGGDCDTPDRTRTPEIGRLEDLARACGVADRVVFEGRKPRSELRRWYAACDVFVTTPWYEPFGITPLEAMACARPVIASAVGGLKYSVENGVTGLLVPSRDPESLASAIAALRADLPRARSMGVAGLERARRHFTWEKIARELAVVFKDVAANGRDAATRVGTKSPAIFLDKDGTLVEDIPYNIDPELVRFTPHAIEALQLWRDAGYRLVVVTNQPGVGLGFYDLAAIDRLHASLAARLGRARVSIDGFFACPHLAESSCACRKPQPGLILTAAKSLDLDLSRSWMIGDILNDVEAGHRAGCRSVLLDVGHETEWQLGASRTPEFCCANLLQAARLTLESSDPEYPPIGGAKKIELAA